ncbi:MAG TPA: ammonium transporter [Spirochaetota bacterium]|nr:ammonium transporter [Spirochaetota bacterium]HOK91318.1 ammonium transporter [Spirochaetota bacterium]HPP93793.1 ammonium transporter [Spirochaetota bacterium]HRU64854.1 ammonium transporter [Spirochaetota bacterium]
MDKIIAADVAWMLCASALVLMMTPALAFFYGGLVRRKNVLSIMMQCYVIMCAVGLMWILVGYSMAFGPDRYGVIGSMDWVFLRGVSIVPDSFYGTSIPHLLFMAFQMMFAIITPALMVGAFAERIRFSSFLFFIILWSLFIYNPVAHWVWANGGWLSKDGALDFAGGTVIHVNAGIAALVVSILLGKRDGLVFPKSPHNLPFAVFGAGFLFFGWFGFNAGSALGANGAAVVAFVTTAIASASAGLVWMFLDWFFNEVPTMLGVATGIVAGLVAITPAAGFVSPVAAIIIGAIGSLIGFFFVTKVKPFFGYDDSLDVFGVHGMCGIWGAIATGIFASKAYGSGSGLIDGNPIQVWIQCKAVIITILYSGIGTALLYFIADFIFGMRVSLREEHVGLDLTQHHESGYTLME